MIYFHQDETMLTRWEAREYRTNPITGERSVVVHARIHEVTDREEYTIYWFAVSPGTRKTRTYHKGDLSGAQDKVLKARLWLTE